MGLEVVGRACRVGRRVGRRVDRRVVGVDVVAQDCEHPSETNAGCGHTEEAVAGQGGHGIYSTLDGIDSGSMDESEMQGEGTNQPFLQERLLG